jgi:hypothetical protein
VIGEIMVRLRIGKGLHDLLAPGWPSLVHEAMETINALPAEVRMELRDDPPYVRLIDSEDSAMGVDVGLQTSSGHLLCVVPYHAVAARPPNDEALDERAEQLLEL